MGQKRSLKSISFLCSFSYKVLSSIISEDIPTDFASYFITTRLSTAPKKFVRISISSPLPPPQYGDEEVNGYDNGEDECDGCGEALLLCEGGARAIWVVGLCVTHMLCGQEQRNKKGKNHSPQAKTEPHQPSRCHHDEQDDGRPQVGGSWKG